MAYNEKREIYKHAARNKDYKPNIFRHEKPPKQIFKNVTVLEAIEQIKLDKKLIIKVSTVITSTAFNTFSTEYQEKIQAIADIIRKEKMY